MRVNLAVKGTGYNETLAAKGRNRPATRCAAWVAVSRRHDAPRLTRPRTAPVLAQIDDPASSLLIVRRELRGGCTFTDSRCNGARRSGRGGRSGGHVDVQ